MDIACGSTLHEQGLLVHFLITVFYLAVVSLAFLLLHYLQHIQRLSNLFSLTLGGTFLFLLVSFPPFVRSVHILIPSITLLLDVVSFPLYTVFYEAFPTPLIQILSIGMKMITILYSIEQVLPFFFFSRRVVIASAASLAKFVPLFSPIAWTRILACGRKDPLCFHSSNSGPTSSWSSFRTPFSSPWRLLSSSRLFWKPPSPYSSSRVFSLSTLFVGCFGNLYHPFFFYH